MLLLFAFVLLLFTCNSAIACPDDQQACIELWQKATAGDESAMRRLTEMGPEARSLMNTVMFPGGNDQLLDTENDGIDEKTRKLCLEVFYSTKAEFVPAVASCLSRMDDIDTENWLLRLDTIGIMAQPACQALETMYPEQPEFNQLAILRILARTNEGQELRIHELNRHLSVFGNDDRQTQKYLDIYRLCPEHQVFEKLSHVAKNYPDSAIRAEALRCLVEGDPEAPLLNDVLLDCLTVGPGETALESLVAKKSLPSWMALSLCKRFYQRSFEHTYLSPLLLAEAICRCESLDAEVAVFIEKKLRELLRDDTWIDNSLAPPFMRANAASVILRWNPNDKEAADYLQKSLRLPAPTQRSIGNAGTTRDVRSDAAWGLARVRDCKTTDVQELVRIWQTEYNEFPDSDFSLVGMAAIAKLDSKRQPCIDALNRTSLLQLELTLSHRCGISSDDFNLIARVRTQTINENRALLQAIENPGVVEKLNEDLGDELLNWESFRRNQTEFVPQFAKHLDSPSLKTRLASLVAIRFIGEGDPTAAALLASRLTDQSIFIRLAAIEALGKLGSASTAELPALENVKQSNYLSEQVAASWAITQIQRANPTLRHFWSTKGQAHEILAWRSRVKLRNL